MADQVCDPKVTDRDRLLPPNQLGSIEDSMRLENDQLRGIGNSFNPVQREGGVFPASQNNPGYAAPTNFDQAAHSGMNRLEAYNAIPLNQVQMHQTTGFQPSSTHVYGQVTSHVYVFLINTVIAVHGIIVSATV